MHNSFMNNYYSKLPIICRIGKFEAQMTDSAAKNEQILLRQNKYM